jgi:hypothetical protein
VGIQAGDRTKGERMFSGKETRSDWGLVRDWVECQLLDDLSEAINIQWLAEELTDRLYEDNQQRINLDTPIKSMEVKSLILEIAKQWDYEVEAAQGGPLVQEEI